MATASDNYFSSVFACINATSFPRCLPNFIREAPGDFGRCIYAGLMMQWIGTKPLQIIHKKEQYLLNKA